MSEDNKELKEYQELDKLEQLKIKREFFRIAAEKARQMRLRAERTKARIQAEIEKNKKNHENI